MAQELDMVKKRHELGAACANSVLLSCGIEVG